MENHPSWQVCIGGPEILRRNNMPGSKDVARAAIRLALSVSREEERALKARYAELDIKVAAVDFGGEFLTSVMRIVECCVVAAKREGIIGETHHEEGAVPARRENLFHRSLPRPSALTWAVRSASPVMASILSWVCFLASDYYTLTKWPSAWGIG